jgi:hypothetical protein
MEFSLVLVLAENKCLMQQNILGLDGKFAYCEI